MTILNDGDTTKKYREGFVSVIEIEGIALELGHHVINTFYADTKEEALAACEEGKKKALERGEKIMKDDGTF